MKNNEILKRSNLEERFIIEVFDKKVHDVSYDIMPAGNTLEDTIVTAWRIWDNLPHSLRARNGRITRVCSRMGERRSP